MPDWPAIDAADRPSAAEGGVRTLLERAWRRRSGAIVLDELTFAVAAIAAVVAAALAIHAAGDGDGWLVGRGTHALVGLGAWTLLCVVRAGWRVRRARRGGIGPWLGRADRTGRLRSAWELAAVPARGRDLGAGDKGSPALVGLAVHAAAGAALALLDDTSRARRAALGRHLLIGLVVALGAWGAHATGGAAWGALWVAPPAPTTAVREVGTLVADLRLRVTPPDYAASAVAVEETSAEELEVLEGSELALSARLLPIAADATLHTRQEGEEADAGERRRLEVGADRTVRHHTIAQAGFLYRFEASRGPSVAPGAAGPPRKLVERGWRQVRVRADALPTAQISAPRGEVEVRQGDRVVLDGVAHDDIGLAAVAVLITLPSGEVRRRSVAMSAGDRTAVVRESVDVDALELRPDQRAIIELEARDVRTGAGGEARSNRLTLRMFSAERHHERLLDRLDALAMQWTVRLADRLEQDPALDELTLVAALDRHSAHAREEARALRALDELRAAFAEDTVARAKTVADLDEIAAALTDRLGREERALLGLDRGAAGHPAAFAMSVVRREHGRSVRVIERALSLLIGLAVAEQRSAVARSGEALETAQEALADALDRAAANPDDAEAVAEAERLLDSMEAEMQRMMAAAERQMRLVPAEHVNAGAFEPRGLRGDLMTQQDALAEVRSLLRQGKIKEALEKARQLRERTQEMIGGLRTELDAERSAEEQRLAKLVAETRRGIAKARDAEVGVRDAARPFAEEQARAQAERMRAVQQDVAPGVASMLRRARDQIRPRRLESEAARAAPATADARAALSTALEAVERGDTDTAMRAMAEAQDALSAARDGAAKPASGEGEGPASVAQRGRDADRFDAALDRVRRASGRLRDAMPRPGEGMATPDRRALDGQRRGQERIRRGLERVRKRLAEHGKAHPALQRQVGDRLDHAAESMREAERALERGDAQRAHDAAADTLRALDDAASTLQEHDARQLAPQQRDGEQVGLGEQRVEMKVEGGNASDRAERYREDLLRAMQQPAPPDYGERLRRYYKAITR